VTGTFLRRVAPVVAGDDEREERLDVRLVIECLGVADQELDGHSIPIEIVPGREVMPHGARREHETMIGALTYPATTESARAAALDGWYVVMGTP
jgi:hypothetical protein